MDLLGKFKMRKLCVEDLKSVMESDWADLVGSE